MSVTLVLVVVTAVISIYAFNNPELISKMAHWPAREFHAKEYYRLLTSGFVHVDWIHLLVNLFVFYHFGEVAEQHYQIFFGATNGKLLFLLVYILTIVGAALPTYFEKKNIREYRAVGASGGVSGIVFIYILLYPWQKLYLYGVIPIPGIVAGVLYLAYSSYADKKNIHTRIGHSAHFYGALFGIALTLLLKPDLFSSFLRSLINDFPL